MINLQFLAVSFATVTKLVAAVIPGMVVASFFKDLTHTLEGFSYITLRICLSCMLFSNLCRDISLNFLSTYFWAVIMSLIPMMLGVFSSLALGKLLPKESRILLILGSTFQNGLEVPLSVVTSIKGIDWLDERGVEICQQYVFLYNLTCAIGLWSSGSTMIKHYKDKRLKEIQDALEKESFRQGSPETMKAVAELVKQSESFLLAEEKGKDPQNRNEGEANEHEEVEEPTKSPTFLSPTIVAPTTSVFRPRRLPNLSPIDTGVEHLLYTGEKVGLSIHQSLNGEVLTREDSWRSVSFQREASFVRSPLGGPCLTAEENLISYRPRRRRERSINVKKYDKLMEEKSRMSALSAAEDDTPLRSRDQGRTETAKSSRKTKSAGWPPKAVVENESPLASPYDSMKISLTAFNARFSSPQVTPSIKNWESNVSHSMSWRNLRREDGKLQITQRQEKEEELAYMLHPRSSSDDHFSVHNADDEEITVALGSNATLRIGSDTLKGNLLPNDSSLVANYSEVISTQVVSCETGSQHQSTDVREDKKRCFSAFFPHQPDEVRDSSERISEKKLGNTDSLRFSTDFFAFKDANTVVATVEFPSAEDVEMRWRDRPLKSQLLHVWSMIKFVLLTPPITLSIIGIFVALVPPLRWLSNTTAGASLVEATRLVGKGCVPFQLLTLGLTISPANLRVDSDPRLEHNFHSLTEKEHTRSESDSQYSQAKSSFSASIFSVLRKPFCSILEFWQRISANVQLIVLCLSLRLVLLPALALFIVHWLVKTGVMPSDKLFVFSICIGVSSPAAVNASLVCTMHGYYHRQFAKLIFFMYCFAAVTYTFWISASISYANHMD